MQHPWSSFFAGEHRKGKKRQRTKGGNARGGVKRCASLLFALCVALTGVLPLGVTAASAAEAGLGQLKGDGVVNGAAGYEMEKRSGNNLAVSEVESAYFTYSADISYMDGNTVSLMFGAESTDAGSIGNGTDNKFFGAELSRDVAAGADKATLRLKMFQDGNGSIGEVIHQQVVAADVDTTQPVSFRVVVTVEKELEFYVNESRADVTIDPDDLARFQGAYAGGYLGLVTFDTAARFSNVTLVNQGAEVADVFRTNLPGLTFINGAWNRTENGLYSNGDDVFAMSDARVKNFILEATVTIEGKAAAWR